MEPFCGFTLSSKFMLAPMIEPARRIILVMEGGSFVRGRVHGNFVVITVESSFVTIDQFM